MPVELCLRFAFGTALRAFVIMEGPMLKKLAIALTAITFTLALTGCGGEKKTAEAKDVKPAGKTAAVNFIKPEVNHKPLRFLTEDKNTMFPRQIVFLLSRAAAAPGMYTAEWWSWDWMASVCCRLTGSLL